MSATWPPRIVCEGGRIGAHQDCVRLAGSERTADGVSRSRSSSSRFAGSATITTLPASITVSLFGLLSSASLGHELAFLRHMLRVLLRVRVEELHHRALRNERRNAVRFVRNEL
jgi:hypothetical protein